MNGLNITISSSLDSRDVSKLLHPECMTQKELLSILQQLCVHMPNDVTKSKLIETFKKVALPLPQRNKSKDSEQTNQSLDKTSSIVKNKLTTEKSSKKKIKLNRNNFLANKVSTDQLKSHIHSRDITSNGFDGFAALKRSHLNQKINMDMKKMKLT